MNQLVQRRPFRGLQNLQQEIDHLFDSFPFFGNEDGDRSAVWAPRMDLTEDDGHYVVRMDLPGLTKKDINVALQDNRLVVSGERKEEKTEAKEGFRRQERHVGTFYRACAFPMPVDEDAVEASFANGVLTVHVKKTEEVKPKQIEIR